MKIGYIRLDRGDWAKNNYNSQEIGLAKAFETLGHQTYIVYWLHPKDKRCFSEVKISNYITKLYFPYRFRVFHHAIVDLNLLKAYKLELLHIQSDNLLYVPYAINYCLKNKIPHYCYIGTIKSNNKNPFIRRIINLISIRNIHAFKKTLVFAKTPQMANILKQKGVNNVKTATVGLDISLIPDTIINTEQFKQKLQITQNKKIIVCVCALRHDKHPFDIFKLAELLNDDYQIIFIGTDGPLKNEFITILNSKEEYHIINYIGQVSNQEIHKFYQIANYVVNFNPNEIFGMAILEAMYHECTVIAIEAPGPNCIIENKKTGFIAHSIQEMALIIKNGEKAHNARQRILESFTWEKTAQTFLSYFSNKE